MLLPPPAPAESWRARALEIFRRSELVLSYRFTSGRSTLSRRCLDSLQQERDNAGSMIAIIDYGMGNLRSVQKGFEKMGYPAEITRDPHRIETAPGVVLPGVGAFGA